MRLLSLQAVEAMKQLLRDPVKVKVELFAKDGTSKVWTEADITKLSFDSSEDNLGLELPTQDFTMSINNINHEFDIDNPTGIYDKMEHGLKMEFSVGIKCEWEGELVTEWVKVGTGYLKDTPKVNRMEATLYFTDFFVDFTDYLEDTTLGGVDAQIDMQRGVDAVLNKFGFPNCVFKHGINARYTDYTMTPGDAYLTRLPATQWLQLMNMTAGITMRFDSSGLLECTNRYNMHSNTGGYSPYVMSDVYLKAEDILGEIQTSKLDKIRNILYQSDSVYDSRDNIIRGEIQQYLTETLTPTGDGGYIIEHPPLLSYSIYLIPDVDTPEGELPTPLPNVDRLNSEFGTERSIIRFTDSNIPTSFRLWAAYSESKSAIITTRVSNSGSDFVVDNPTLIRVELGTVQRGTLAYASWVMKNFGDLRQYEFDYVQDYRLETGDCIYIQTPYEERVPVRIVKHTINLPGVTGHIVARRLPPSLIATT